MEHPSVLHIRHSSVKTKDHRPRSSITTSTNALFPHINRWRRSHHYTNEFLNNNCLNLWFKHFVKNWLKKTRNSIFRSFAVFRFREFLPSCYSGKSISILLRNMMDYLLCHPLSRERWWHASTGKACSWLEYVSCDLFANIQKKRIT